MIYTYKLITNGWRCTYLDREGWYLWAWLVSSIYDHLNDHILEALVSLSANFHSSILSIWSLHAPTTEEEPEHIHIVMKLSFPKEMRNKQESDQDQIDDKPGRESPHLQVVQMIGSKRVLFEEIFPSCGSAFPRKIPGHECQSLTLSPRRGSWFWDEIYV